jgi:hypothetical protein
MSVLRWLTPAMLAATVIAAGSLLAPSPVQAQNVTVLQGSPTQPSPSIDCNNPDYYQYCQANDVANNQNYSPYDYEDAYPYYGYGFPVGVGVGHRFFHRGGFHDGFRRFHGGFHRGGFRGGGFHGGGFHGGGFHGGGFHGGGHR